MTTKHVIESMAQHHRMAAHIVVAENRLKEYGDNAGADAFLIASAQQIAAQTIREGGSGHLAYNMGRDEIDRQLRKSNVVPFRRVKA